jgi:hypothetical protein
MIQRATESDEAGREQVLVAFKKIPDMVTVVPS